FLRAAKSELGEVDAAAAFEFQRQRLFEYIAPATSSCLVELDEEPPHPLNREALAIAIAIARALNSVVVDEIHVMRKIVIDGSNTTGFQRTAIVALGGYIVDDEGVVGVQTVAVEEDAARKISEGGGTATYSLDRLGVPLIEISTAPDIRSPQQARRVAEKIGLTLRLTGRVKRGIGTIRQDLNLSIEGSPKIEVKGVQRLELIPRVVEEEVRRLVGLKMIQEELGRRGATANEIAAQRPVDVTSIVASSGSRFVSEVVKSGGRAYAVRLPKFSGILGVELQHNRRFGTELADYARQWAGVRGIVHSDELPGYGIGEDVVRDISRALEVGELDAFVVVVDTAERALRALEAVKNRCIDALAGIPRETRGANEDGTTRYLRPQPGAARMYPETDVPPMRVDNDLLSEASRYTPVTVDEKIQRLVKLYSLSQELAHQLIQSEYLSIYEEVVDVYGVDPRLMAAVFTSLAGELRREGVYLEALEDRHIHMLARAVKELGLDKDSIKVAIATLYQNPSIDYQAYTSLLSRRRVGEEEVRRVVRARIEESREEVLRRGDRAFQYIMGRVMADLRGRVDGKVVAAIVREELSRVVNPG
ncbi:MAG: Glu-tRNA(Gln) amidotransferase subunit GatE, partial [Ignisphaera sp.]|nr:Glu-tRNA(Gln) amidotransferase subunit GatE [Ignisphaera sp.]MDW8085769.1 Glu-tRNA(Gln) amidotransferase subunit GatE [Ignisphaera sp.]